MPERTAYFRPALFEFLTGLAAHNDRTWFQAHKPEYEREVRDASLAFIEGVGPRLAKLSPKLVADPRPVGGSMTRIYRDIRFSKDKSPYKTNVGIHFFHQAIEERERSLPGFYLHLGPKEAFVAAGMWHPEGPDLAKIRGAIVKGPSAWKRAKAPPIELEGESLQRVPPGYPKDHPMAEDLRRKDFIASIAIPPSQVARPDFPQRFYSTCRDLDPLNRFLAKAVGVAY